MEAIHIAATPAELYNAVLVDTPLGKVFHLKNLISSNSDLFSHGGESHDILYL